MRMVKLVELLDRGRFTRSAVWDLTGQASQFYRLTNSDRSGQCVPGPLCPTGVGCPALRSAIRRFVWSTFGRADDSTCDLPSANVKQSDIKRAIDGIGRLHAGPLTFASSPTGCASSLAKLFVL